MGITSKIRSYKDFSLYITYSQPQISLSLSFCLSLIRIMLDLQLALDSMSACSATQLCHTLQPHGLWPARLLCPWNFSGKNTGVDCYFLLQGIFWTQGLNSVSPALAGRFFATEPLGKSLYGMHNLTNSSKLNSETY